MNWDAIGAVGEITGAAAVVLSLIVLAIQVRHSTRALVESNRLNRVAALDRHADSIARWRGRITEHEALSKLWLLASNDGDLSDLDILRLNNLWIEFVNTQRSNYVRALTVGDAGLARQAVLSVAAQACESRTFGELWHSVRSWTELASPDYIVAVENALSDMRQHGTGAYRPMPTITKNNKEEHDG